MTQFQTLLHTSTTRAREGDVELDRLLAMIPSPEAIARDDEAKLEKQRAYVRAWQQNNREKARAAVRASKKKKRDKQARLREALRQDNQSRQTDTSPVFLYDDPQFLRHLPPMGGPLLPPNFFEVMA